jgi:methylglutaconyl-CoA hydratase
MAAKKSKKPAAPGAAPGATAPSADSGAADSAADKSRAALLRIEDGVATLILNRPDQRNAISPAMIDDLERAFAACAAPEVRVMIVTGAGPAFSGGMDLAALRETADQPAAKHLADARRLGALFKSLYTMPCPTIAAVNGPAIAGGCGLATLCDFVLAAPGATFGYPEVNIGFVPALVSVFLVRQLGDRRARELLMSGRIIKADEAARLGLITEVVAADKLLLRAHDLAARLASHSPSSLRETKTLLRDLADVDLDRALEAAASLSARIRQTGDFKEGLSAFLEKRRPVWRSR